MKYKTGDILWYVNPFLPLIETVKIDMGILEGDELFYIDSVGSYLKEEDLFDALKDAKRKALDNLEKFYTESKFKILNYK